MTVIYIRMYWHFHSCCSYEWEFNACCFENWTGSNDNLEIEI